MSLKTIAFVLGALFVVVGVGAVLIFSLQPKPIEDLRLKVTVEDKVFVGVPFDVKVLVDNSSRSVLRDATLALELPESMAFIGSSAGKKVETKDLGFVESSDSVQEKFQLIVLGDENSIQEVKARLTYHLPSFNATFEKTATFNVLVGDSGVALDLEAPDEVYGGEEFDVAIRYKNRAEFDFPNAHVRMVYPEAFRIARTSEPLEGNQNVLELDSFAKGREGEITVAGDIVQADNTVHTFEVFLEVNYFGYSYIISEKRAAVKIATSPFSLELTLGREADTIAYPGSQLAYRLGYRNNTDVPFQDVIIRVRFYGELFDIRRVSGRGVLRSDNVLVFDAADVPELRLVPPRGSGEIGFSIPLKNEYPIRNVNDKNFTVRVEAEMESPTVPTRVTAKKTVAVASLTTKIGGKFKIEAKGYFRDADSLILNEGPLPPRVGAPTQFTIHFQISNYATDLSNLEVRSTLGDNVRFTGIVKGNSNIAPMIDERTRDIIWKVPKVFATTGILDEPLETIFQVEAVPAINQVGREMRLIETVVARATDEFTGLELQANANTVSTVTLADPTVRPQDGRVQP